MVFHMLYATQYDFSLSSVCRSGRAERSRDLLQTSYMLVVSIYSNFLLSDKILSAFSKTSCRICRARCNTAAPAAESAAVLQILLQICSIAADSAAVLQRILQKLLQTCSICCRLCCRLCSFALQNVASYCS